MYTFYFIFIFYRQNEVWMNENMLLYWMYVVRLNAPQRCAWQKEQKEKKKKKKWKMRYRILLLVKLFYCVVLVSSVWKNIGMTINADSHFFFLVSDCLFGLFFGLLVFSGWGGGWEGELFGRTGMQKTMSAVTADLTVTCGCFSLVPRATCMNMQHRLHPSPRTPECFQSQYLLIPKISSQNKYEINKAF